MTLSPGQKLPAEALDADVAGRVQRVLELALSERAPRPPRFIGDSTWMLRIGSRPKRFGMRSRTFANSFRTPSSASIASTKWKSPFSDRGEVGHQTLVDLMGVDDDPALGGLAEDFGQAHHRHGTRGDDVGQRLARPDRGQLIDIADQQ